MTTILLIIGAFLLIYVYSVHVMFMDDKNYLKSAYMRNPILMITPILSGLILPVIAWSYIFDWHWLILFIANLILANLFASILGKDVFISETNCGKLLRKRRIALVLGLALMSLGIMLQS